jgi:hypothetical protein
MADMMPEATVGPTAKSLRRRTSQDDSDDNHDDDDALLVDFAALHQPNRNRLWCGLLATGVAIFIMATCLLVTNTRQLSGTKTVQETQNKAGVVRKIDAGIISGVGTSPAPNASLTTNVTSAPTNSTVEPEPTITISHY